MKGNLKERVAKLESSVEELTKRNATLLNRIDNFLVPRLHKHDNELIELRTIVEGSTSD